MTKRTKRTIALVAAGTILMSACGGGGGSQEGGSTPSTDRFGNPIEAGEDWSAGGSGDTDSEDEAGAGGSGDAAGSDSAAGVTPTTELVCERPESPEFDPSQAPPGFDPNAPISEAEDDFPFEVSMQPTRGDAGEPVEITATVVAPSRVLVAVLARFHDGESHGMDAAKFADATGRAVFRGPIPLDAPEGLLILTISASTQDNKSAIETLDFTVTGERCT